MTSAKRVEKGTNVPLIYRVTNWIVPNLLLTSKQKLHLSIRSIQRGDLFFANLVKQDPGRARQSS